MSAIPVTLIMSGEGRGRKEWLLKEGMTEKEGMNIYLVPVEEGMKDEGRNDMRMKER